MTKHTRFTKILSVLCAFVLFISAIGLQTFAQTGGTEKQYTELSFDDYGISDNTYDKDEVYGSAQGVTDMDGVAFSGKIKFGGNGGNSAAYVRIGGKSEDKRTNALGIFYNSNTICLFDHLDGGVNQLVRVEASGLLVNPLEKAVNVRLTFDYENTADVRVTFSVEGKEYYNEVLIGAVAKIGTYMVVSSTTLPITVESVEVETGSKDPMKDYRVLTFTDLGYEKTVTISNDQMSKSVTEGDLNNVAIEGYYNFSKNAALNYAFIGGEKQGIRLAPTASGNMYVHYFNPSSAATELGAIMAKDAGTLTETDVKIKVGFAFSNVNKEENTGDVKVTILISDTYQTEYNLTNVSLESFKKTVRIVSSSADAPLTITSIEKETEKPEETVLTFTDLGYDKTVTINNDEMSKSVAEGDLNNVAIEGYYNFSKNAGLNLAFIGGEKQGIRLAPTASGNMYVHYFNPSSVATELGAIMAKDAGTLTETDVKIKVGFAFSNVNKEQNTGNVKVTILISDTYQTEYNLTNVSLESFKKTVRIVSSSVDAPLTIKAIATEDDTLLPSEELEDITLVDFGIDEGYVKNTNDGSYVGASLDGTRFTTYITFTENPTEGGSYLQFGATDAEDDGVVIQTSLSSDGELLFKDLNNDSDEGSVISSAIAGTNIFNTKVKLTLTAEFLDGDGDHGEDDVLIGVYFNDVLYNDAAFILLDRATTFGRNLKFVTNDENYPIILGNPEVEKPELTKVNLSEIGITNGTYGYNTNLSVSGMYTPSLMNTVTTQKITFSKHAGTSICYAGSPSAWHGIGFTVNEEGTISIHSRTKEFKERYTLDPEIAGRPLVGEEIELTLELFEFGNDAKLGVYINGNLYNNEYFHLTGGKASLGGYVGIYIPKEEATVKIVSENVVVEKPALTSFNMSQLGIVNGLYKYNNGNLVASGSHFKSLVNTVTTQKFVFSNHKNNWMMYAGGQSAWHGIRFQAKTDGTIFIRSTSAAIPEEYTLKPEVAGATLVGEEVELKIELFENQKNPKDAMLGVYVNGKLYNNQYFKFTNAIDTLGNYIGFYIEQQEGTIKLGIPDPTPTVNPNFTKVTFDSYDIMTGTYAYNKGGMAVSGNCELESMDRVVFSDIVNFSKEPGAQLHIGGGKSEWHGMIFTSTEAGNLYFREATGKFSPISFMAETAGVQLVGRDVELTVSIEYVDSDGDGDKDDVKLGVWFDGKAYNDRWIYLPNYAEYLGGYLGICCPNEQTSLSIKTYMKPIDFAEFGFTINWAFELGLKKK